MADEPYRQGQPVYTDPLAGTQRSTLEPDRDKYRANVVLVEPRATQARVETVPPPRDVAEPSVLALLVAAAGLYRKVRRALAVALYVPFLLLLAAEVRAQEPVKTGSTFAFDHTDQANTAFYELCVDVVTDAACGRIATMPGELLEIRFTLPATVPKGVHQLAVRAVGYLNTGPSGPSNSLERRIVGTPLPPQSFRVMP